MAYYTYTRTANADGILLVKSTEDIELVPGFHRCVEDMADCKVTHAFTVLEKIHETESAGFIFKWYKVTDYSYSSDKTAVVEREIKKSNVTNSIMFVTLAEIGAIDSVTAGEHSDMFEEWNTDVEYDIGNIRRYKEKLYKCVQNHVSQSDWTPDTTQALWKNIADPADEWPEWSQPVGAHDAYMTGDKVTHANSHWTSMTDNNVWEPGAAGTYNLWVKAE